jgi:fatty-acyl-CoA synthase
LIFLRSPQALQHDLSSLSLLSGGGAAMPEAVATMLAERFGLYYNEAYGLTETAAFLHANPLTRGKRQCLGYTHAKCGIAHRRPGDAGRLAPG